jgi:hypothetical protein
MDDSSRKSIVQISRRRLLQLTTVGATASVAGCDQSDTADTTEPTDPAPTTSDPGTAAGTQTQTPTDGETPTPTDSNTSGGETTTASGSSFADNMRRSPSSHIAPADGFADPSWVDDVDLQILRVTTLDSTGEGSLRWAVNQSGPRLVVFEVGGVIDLDEDGIYIDEGNCWVAGHTAPDPGVTTIRGPFEVGASECIVQHVRSRPGDAGNDGGWAPDAINTDNETTDNVIDHCTAMWSVDEALTVGYNTRRTTVSNCMIAEALNDASHPKGLHGYGSLTGDGATKVTYAGNLWAHNTARNPRLKAETESVVANNVVHDFDEAANLDESTVAVIHGNAYLRGKQGAHIEGAVSGGTNSRASVTENYTDRDTEMTQSIYPLSIRPFWPPTLEAVGGEAALDRVPQSVGARPAQRDSHEQRVIQNLQDQTGSYIDSQTDVGGYPDFDPVERSLDVPDGDGDLADWLYQHRRAVELPDASPP